MVYTFMTLYIYIYIKGHFIYTQRHILKYKNILSFDVVGLK